MVIKIRPDRGQFIYLFGAKKAARCTVVIESLQGQRAVNMFINMFKKALKSKPELIQIEIKESIYDQLTKELLRNNLDLI